MSILNKGQMNNKEQKVESSTEALPFERLAISGSASNFEIELYKLINAYVSAGLTKPDLVHKMESVTQSCRVS